MTSEVLGGWVESMAEQLNQNSDIELGIVCKCEENLSFHEVIDGITLQERENLMAEARRLAKEQNL
jgi:hypothetical protein